jgi:hypothetical protein
MTLRAIAAWLESRPAAPTVAFIDFDPVLGTTVLGSPRRRRARALYEKARLIGRDWMPNWRDRLGVEWQIAPGVVYRLRDAR